MPFNRRNTVSPCSGERTFVGTKFSFLLYAQGSQPEIKSPFRRPSRWFRWRHDFLFTSPTAPLPRAGPCLAGFQIPGIERLWPNIYFRIRTVRTGTIETFLESSRQPDLNRQPPARRGVGMKSENISATFPLDHAVSLLITIINISHESRGFGCEVPQIMIRLPQIRILL